jgi:hypothetical protein
MTERLPTEPSRAHTPPSPPDELSPNTGGELLHAGEEDDDKIATELPTILPPAHHNGRRRGNDAIWTLRPALVRAQTQEEIEEEELHRRLGFRYNRYKYIKAKRRWFHPFLAWWSRHVSVKIDVAERRDHLGMQKLHTCMSHLVWRSR